MLIRGFFITGTGTDVGKTIAAAGVTRRLLKQGVDAMIMKPVQTGSLNGTAPDVDFLSQAGEISVAPEARQHVTPFLYEPACSPHLAAKLAGKPISIPAILSSAQWLAARHQVLVVEGAGGLMVPLGEHSMMIDLISALALPVILTAHAGLGTINHVLLSLEALRIRNLKIAGVVISETVPTSDEDRFILEDNSQAIKAFGNVRVLARIPWLGKPVDLGLLDSSFESCDLAGMLVS